MIPGKMKWRTIDIFLIKETVLSFNLVYAIYNAILVIMVEKESGLNILCN